jgi:hypothetical protein
MKKIGYVCSKNLKVFFGPQKFGTRNHLHTMKWKEGRSLDFKVLILVLVFYEIEHDG